MSKKKALIIGAGVAGLTAAYELVHKSDIVPIIFEMSDYLGGISRTVNYKGNRIDIGGHRFFSKSDMIMKWWLNVMPLQGTPSEDDTILKRNLPLSKAANAPDPKTNDKVMLIRKRISRIYFLRKFFDYPIKLNKNTFLHLGVIRLLKMALSYIYIKFLPIKEENSLEDFFINRFGKTLYLTFFKDYTQKVWGVPCKNIKPDWGAQRVKDLSITKAIKHAIKHAFIKDVSIEQKGVSTSLIGQFMYPKYGPGHFWEEVARIVESKGAQIFLNHKVVAIKTSNGNSNGNIDGILVQNVLTGEIIPYECDFLLSSMPVKELINAFNPLAPSEVCEVAEGLRYRDFITVGLLVQRLKVKNDTAISTINSIIPDNWIYVQEADVKLGRIQVFNNWSPYMVSDDKCVWLGLEYFCNEGDELWQKTDDELSRFAIDEMLKIGFIDKEDVLDTVVIRMLKTYPAYFGSYEHFNVIRTFTDSFKNLFLIGRNGMHRYNNMDHSMLSAMIAVDNIINNIHTKDNVWNINVEKDYYEQK